MNNFPSKLGTCAIQRNFKIVTHRYTKQLGLHFSQRKRNLQHKKILDKHSFDFALKLLHGYTCKAFMEQPTIIIETNAYQEVLELRFGEDPGGNRSTR